MRSILAHLLVLCCLPTLACDSEDAPGDVAPDTAADTTTPEVEPDTVGDVADDADADVEVAIVDGPGLGIDYTLTPPGATPRWDLAADDWMSVGWPSDRFRAGGHVRLTNMPQRVAGLLKTYMAFGEEVLDGWGLNGAIYFELDGAIDPSALPAPEATLSADAPIQLVNVSATSAASGQRMPLVFSFYATGNDPFYSPNTLALRPVYGFPLVEGDTYCAIVTRAVKDAAGHYLQQAPALAAGLASEPSLAPLVAWLPSSPLARADIAVATCFTTQDATGELERVARWIDDMVPPELDLVFEPGVWGEFHGLYTAPNFQAGMKPYQADGDIRFDERGDPIPQADEEIRFLLLTPTDHEMPESGWPVTIYAHGTGGDYESCRDDTEELVMDGIAVLCVDQPLHGPRGPDGALLTDIELVLYSFNFVNPHAGRSSFRQAAIDTLILSRMIEADRFALAPEQTKSSEGLRLDPERIYFFGHSHGGLSGTLALAVDPRIKAGVISGMSGVIIETILRRKDPADLAELAANLLNIDIEDLDSFHPALNLMQMLVDATDPINYTRYWLHPRRLIPPKHVFVTEGTLDAASPSVGTDAATAAGLVPQLHPLAKRSDPHELRGLAPVDLPLKGNVDLGGGVTRTAALRQWQGGLHWVAFQAADARALWRHFLWSEAYGDGAELAYGVVPVARPTPVSAADTCAGAHEIPIGAGFPIQVAGTTRLAHPDHASAGCGDDAAELGAPGRDVFYRFTAPTEGLYRFRIALQPAIDRDHPRFGPDLVTVLEGCGLTCFGRKADGAIDVNLGQEQSVIVVVDGTTPADVGPFTLIIEQRCLVLDCDERECGNYGCGNCGQCDGDSTCNADGKCVPRTAGDSCAQPIEIDAVPFRWSGDTRDFENDASYLNGQCAAFPFTLGQGSDDVVFRFVPPTTGPFVATLDGDYDVNVWVSETCEDAGASCLEARRTGRRDARLLIDGVAGEPVFVFVDGAGNTSNSSGHATLELAACVPDCQGRACGDDGCGGSCGPCPDGGSCVTVPGRCAIPYDCPPTTECRQVAGDRCESAIVVGELPWTNAQSTGGFFPDYGVGATWCPLQPDGSGARETGGFGAADVAYAFTAPKTALYRFGLDTGAPPNVFDATLYLASDCDDIAQSCVGADQRDRNERVWANLEAGETVFAIVDGRNNFSGQSGAYTLEVKECVASCENRECGSDGCIGSCGECGDGLSCQGGRCRPPPGTICSNPRGVGRLPWSETLDTTGFGSDRESACEGAAGSAASPEVTYRFEAPEDGTYRFTVRAAFGAQVYLDGQCGEALCLAGGQIPPGDAGDFRTDRAMVKGEVVLVTIDGADVGGAPSAGPFTIGVAVACDPQCDGKTCGPDGCGGVCGVCAFPADVCRDDQTCLDPTTVVGNTCAAPFTVGALPFSGTGDTRAALDENLVDEGQCGGMVLKGMGSADEIWQLTADAAGAYVVDVAPEGWDAIVYALGDCADPVGTCRGLSDAQAGESLTLTLGAGDSVFIVVDGEDNVHDDAGPYRIEVRRQ